MNQKLVNVFEEKDIDNCNSKINTYIIYIQSFFTHVCSLTCF